MNFSFPKNWCPIPVSVRRSEDRHPIRRCHHPSTPRILLIFHVPVLPRSTLASFQFDFASFPSNTGSLCPKTKLLLIDLVWWLASSWYGKPTNFRSYGGAFSDKLFSKFDLLKHRTTEEERGMGGLSYSSSLSVISCRRQASE